MIDLTERLSNRLIKSWTAHGILIFREQAHCVELEVPMLALDAEEIARAIAANLEYIKIQAIPKRRSAQMSRWSNIRRSAQPGNAS